MLTVLKLKLIVIDLFPFLIMQIQKL